VKIYGSPRGPLERTLSAMNRERLYERLSCDGCPNPP
jgi:hypothetical protein